MASMQDYNEIVEEVVREVLRKLGGGTESGGGPGSGGAPAGGGRAGDACAVCVSCGKCVERAPEAVRRIQGAGAARISSSLGVALVGKDAAAFIDHTLLKPDASRGEVETLCREAKQFEFASVCVNPCWVKLAATLLEGTRVKVCSVVGFPLGAAKKEVKAYETRRAILDGAREIDMVMNVGALKSQDYKLVEEDMRDVKDTCGRAVITKVILEMALLTNPEKIKACEIAKHAGMDFVKTSTGFGPGGATVEDVKLMRSVVGEGMGIKAAGGIRDAETAARMIEAGATRIGASASVKIIGG
jgi:deoxyribose-phosphate aldolase